MKSFDVECPVHGKYELIVQPEMDENDLRCPEKINGKPCNERLHKLPSRVQVHYKGNGFYTTDKGK